MIKLRDYTVKLDRLHILGACQDQIGAEFDRVCKAVFGATQDDISDEDWGRLHEYDYPWEEYDPDDPKPLPQIKRWSIDDCLKHGYDLIIRDNHPVRDWEEFAIMVEAKVCGMLPSTPEERMQGRLEAEARAFQQSKDVIRG